MQNTKEQIHIIMTGGTMDSVWDGKQDTIKVAKHSTLPKFFKELKLYPQILFTEVCMKDSRNIKPKDVQKIAQVIKKSPCNKFIITHGTYTMPDTSRFLEVNLHQLNKTVVLTGAMTPLIGFEPSDSSFNLGYAIAKVQELKPGVYIAMNAKTFKPQEVAKNLSEGKFYSVFFDRQ